MTPRGLVRAGAMQSVRWLTTVVGAEAATIAYTHLADPEITLTDAAFLLGYADLSAFSRAFRRWTGMSAQEYRAQRAREA